MTAMVAVDPNGSPPNGPPEGHDIWSQLAAAELRADRHDLGSGSLSDYTYSLYPRFLQVTIRLAGSAPFAIELTQLRALSRPPCEAFVERRLPSEERVDAPMPVRLWLDNELSGVVGFVPPGLEAPVDACLGRLSDRGLAPRIPCEIVATRHGLRVVLEIGRAH